MPVLILCILAVFLAIGVPVAAALGLLGLISSQFFSFMPLHRAIGDIAWQNSIEFLLVAIPMFVLLGEILLRAGIATRMYEAMARWLSWLPGGLMHSNIGASALFAATSGSSVATAATIGTVAVPEIRKRRYRETLFLGSIAAGGTLGILIPPSINLIVYGLLTDTSVPELYLAGFIPGFVLAAVFMLFIAAICIAKPDWGGEQVRYSWRERAVSLIDLLPPLFIFLIVVGSIYAGIATPTEAAALGVMAALGLAAFYKSLSVAMLKLAFENTMRVTSMTMLIILAAIFLNFILVSIGVTDLFVNFIKGLGLTPLQTILVIILAYVILGCFMETLSMLITTAPLVTPIVVSLGYDPVWFGVVLMILLETALVTPPIGINLYVVQGIRKRGDGDIGDVIRGTLPFVTAMFCVIGLLLFEPRIALWLPGQFY